MQREAPLTPPPPPPGSQPALSPPSLAAAAGSFYKEMTDRQLAASKHTSAQAKVDAWANYCALFDTVVAAQDCALTISEQWAFDVVHEFVYSFQVGDPRGAGTRGSKQQQQQRRRRQGVKRGPAAPSRRRGRALAANKMAGRRLEPSCHARAARPHPAPLSPTPLAPPTAAAGAAAILNAAALCTRASASSGRT